MLRRAYYSAYAPAAAWLQRARPVGTPIWHSDAWDVAVVLDSCREGLLREVAPEYPWLGPVDAITSVGSITTEWLAHTFARRHRDHAARTAYVTASPHSETVFDDERVLTHDPETRAPYPSAAVVSRPTLAHIDEVWREGHDPDLGVTPPRAVTNAAIRCWRRNPADRMVVHYLQPHEPFIGADDPPATRRESSVWDDLQAGHADEERVWDAYAATLRLALDEVAMLRRNCDATIAITADHGNAFGEWGIYGHPYGWPQPAVRRVPWTLAEGVDDATHDPPAREDGVAAEREAQLRQLGYA